jgi:hypothetical protein
MSLSLLPCSTDDDYGVGVLWLWRVATVALGGRPSLCARRSLQLGFGENLRRNWFSLVCFAATLHVDTNQRSPISISLDMVFSSEWWTLDRD